MQAAPISGMDASAPPLEAFSDADSGRALDAPLSKTQGDLPPQPVTPPVLGSLGVHEPYVRSLVRKTTDWPRKGVTFLDMSPLLGDARALKHVVDCLVERYGGSGYLTHVAGIDARGFTIGCALAYALNCGFIMVRKEGKLPPGGVGALLSEEYELEYGRGRLEVAAEAFDSSRVTSPRVLLVDDLLATGGTATAACQLLRLAGASIIEVAVLMEIVGGEVDGRKKLKDEGFIDLHSLMVFNEYG